MLKFKQIIVNIGLLLSVLVIQGCQEKVQVITINDEYSLRKTEKEENFKLYHYDVPESESIYEGRFEALNLVGVKYSEEMFILYSFGEKYLYNGRMGKVALEGTPFISYKKDNLEGIYFETSKGLHYMSPIPGLPYFVDEYYRVGGDRGCFIYRKGDKWGVSQKAFHPKDGAKYLDVIPPIYKNIRVIVGHNAFHYVANHDGNWIILDQWGRKRVMTQELHSRGDYYLVYRSTYPDVTASYIKGIRNIPTTINGYCDFLMTTCKYVGSKDAGIIFFDDNHKVRKAFSYPDDRSRQSPNPHDVSFKGPDKFNDYSIG